MSQESVSKKRPWYIYQKECLVICAALLTIYASYTTLTAYTPNYITDTCKIINTQAIDTVCYKNHEFFNCYTVDVTYNLTHNLRTYIRQTSIKLASHTSLINAKVIPCYYHEGDVDNTLCLDTWELPTYIFVPILMFIMMLVCVFVMIIAVVVITQ